MRMAETLAERCDSSVDLLAFALAHHCQRLVKQGLHRDYVTIEEQRIRPKGKVMFGEMLRKRHFGAPQIPCSHDELSVNILPNRILASTLRRLLRTENLSDRSHQEIAAASQLFHHTEDVPLTPALLERVQIHRSIRNYRFAFQLCALLQKCLLPQTGGTGYHFHDFAEDEAKMGTLFESFVRNFLKTEQDVFDVSAPQIEWHVDRALSCREGLELLPTMHTDIILSRGNRHRIIDCKFYKEALKSGRFGAQKFISSHLYQLLAYIRNHALRHPELSIRGALLYPTNQDNIDAHLHLEGHAIRIQSLNLADDWKNIHAALLAFGQDEAIPAAAQIA
jgi:5-methylcytosine-specific restriction enzyme subunit McrC